MRPIIVASIVTSITALAISTTTASMASNINVQYDVLYLMRAGGHSIL
jgi:hypothetical protein